MTLTPPIQVRLEPHTHALLKAEAAALGISISELIRRRLETTQTMLEAFNGLRGDLALLNPDLAQQGRQRAGHGVLGPDWVDLEGLLVEVLYILRSTMLPQAAIAKAEVERIGLPVYVIGKGR